MKFINTSTLALFITLALPLGAIAQTEQTANRETTPMATDAQEGAKNEGLDTGQENAPKAKPKSVRVQHQGFDILFQHVSGVIDESSVCKNQRKIMTRSNCQIAAKKYFQLACHKPSTNLNSEPTSSNKTMYCKAAKSFKPMVAIIGEPSRDTNTQKQRCSSLIAQAINNDNPYVIQRRDRECAKL
jgi:hypothetical protein